MTTTYTWSVNQLLTLPQVSGQSNVVVRSFYTVMGTDGTHTASYYGVQDFTYTGGAFTPFNQLTEAQVVGWIQAALTAPGVANIYIMVQGKIDTLANPPVMPSSQTLPWPH